MIRHRCGDEIADQVVSVALFEQVMTVVDELVARQTAIAEAVDRLSVTRMDDEPAEAERPGRPRLEGFAGWPGSPGT